MKGEVEDDPQTRVGPDIIHQISEAKEKSLRGIRPISAGEDFSSPRLPSQPSRAHLSARSPIPHHTDYDDNQDNYQVLSLTEPNVLITELADHEYNDDIADSPTPDTEEDFVEGSDSGVENEAVEEPEDNVYGPQFVDVATVNADEDDCDTDLELDDELSEHDPTGRSDYTEICEQLGIIPITYVLRQLIDHELCMRYHGCGPVGAKAISLVLRNNVTLDRLDLTGNWIEADGGRSVARMLQENYYIADVCLADNNLLSKGAMHICKMLRNNVGLRKLNLSGNGFTDKDSPYFAEALDDNKYLKELTLSHNRFGQKAGDILGPAIGANDILETLDLSWNHLRREGAIAVSKGIQENVILKVCRLSWNGFGPEGGLAIAEAMITNSSILELDVTGNRMDAACAVRMAKALAINDEIQILRMGNNIITTAGAIALITAITTNESSSMELLDLSDIPVECEFLRIAEDIKQKRPSFRVIHGPVLRAGNSIEDLGKPGMDIVSSRDPIIVLNEHIIVNDMRLVDILKRFDHEDKFTVTPEDFLSALDELAVPFNKTKIENAVAKMATDKSGKVYFGNFLDKQNRPLSAAPQRTEIVR